MNKRRKINGFMQICLIVLIMIVFSGCAGPQDPDKTPPSNQNETAADELKNLLPERTGFQWIYSGFAEYGHAMELESIATSDTSTHYEARGEIYDPSGGEASGDFSLQVQYEVTSESLIMEIKSDKIMDNFPQLELIRLPLNKDTQWEQKAKHKNGKEYNLDCSIQGVEDGIEGKAYSVLYKDKDSDFYEKRRIEENYGVISFETIWESNEGPITMGYDLYREASGYPENITLNSFLPPTEKPLRYFGIAEYAHQGELVKINDTQGETIYQFNGSFEDGSGIPGDFKVQYHIDYQKGTVQEKVVENTRSDKNQVNSKLKDPIILKLPLEVGNTWQQEITFKGQERMMTATIVSIAYEGSTFYTQMKSSTPVMTIRYIVEEASGYFQNRYVEERQFQRGQGIISLSQLMEGNLDIKDLDNDYQVEQAIINHMFGYILERD
ncbi:MAG: hypothetical protein VR72_09485 [Clostridiaceae bacterium BRH_c20a]|nr:MAG: hypothetical protein VR72_09485 [Clostridiaceae bacterium BRH_c20a]